MTGSLGLATHCGKEKVLKAFMKACCYFKVGGRGVKYILDLPTLRTVAP